MNLFEPIFEIQPEDYPPLILREDIKITFEDFMRIYEELYGYTHQDIVDAILECLYPEKDEEFINLKRLSISLYRLKIRCDIEKIISIRKRYTIH